MYEVLTFHEKYEVFVYSGEEKTEILDETGKLKKDIKLFCPKCTTLLSVGEVYLGDDKDKFNSTILYCSECDSDLTLSSNDLNKYPESSRI